MERFGQEERRANMPLPLALRLIRSPLNSLQVSSVASKLRSLPFYIFRDLLLKLLCVG
jgi:hypothetical protein